MTYLALVLVILASIGFGYFWRDLKDTVTRLKDELDELLKRKQPTTEKKSVVVDLDDLEYVVHAEHERKMRELNK